MSSRSVVTNGSSALDLVPRDKRGTTTDEIARLRRRNAELEKQLSELSTVNQALRRVVAEAAHELVEPLITVESGAVELKGDVAGAGAGRAPEERLDAMATVAARGRLLAESLLQDARSAEHPPRLRQVDLGEIVADAVDLATSGASRGRGRIQVGTMPTLVSSPELLSVVVRNLVVNAVKHSSPRAAPISVIAERERAAWRVSVVSSGRPIPAEDVDRIVRRFERAAPRRVPGMGLGLSICVRIMDRLGGTLGVIPEPPVGNRFFVVLPDAAETWPRRGAAASVA